MNYSGSAEVTVKDATIDRSPGQNASVMVSSSQGVTTRTTSIAPGFRT
jgi:hypothetical protein